jgi:hypothetical protein
VTARRVAVLLGAVALVASGVYTVVYLYRWEWHRAIIAGVLFVGTEVALATAAILHRLRKLDERLDHLSLSGAEPDGRGRTRARLSDSAPATRKPFAWLGADRGELNVFLPVLLGAGVLASGLAWVVEAIARSTARPVLERRLAVQLAPLSLPAGGLLGPLAPAPPVVERGRWRRRIGRALLTVMLLVGSFQVVDIVADLTQSRPDPPAGPMDSAVELRLAGKVAALDPTRAGERLWSVCTHVLQRDFPAVEVTDLGDNRVQLLMRTPLGELARRRVRGCLEDAALDHVQAQVLSIRSIPPS